MTATILLNELFRMLSKGLFSIYRRQMISNQFLWLVLVVVSVRRVLSR